MTCRSSRAVILAAALLLPAGLRAQQPAPTELNAETLLFATAAGNVVAVVTSEGAFVVGPLSVASTAPIQAAIARRTASPVRYVIAGPRAMAEAEGDGGWGRLGALVATHEAAWGHLGTEARLAAVGATDPKAAFSEVLKFELGQHPIHIVHQHPGYSNADILVHFESDNLVYLGESLPGDGYPAIDSARGGTLTGLIETLNPWTRNGQRFVPARGPVLAASDILAFRDMLVAMQTRVRALAQSGQSADQVVAAHPSAEFDARYGHGRVSADTFVREIYRAVAAH